MKESSSLPDILKQNEFYDLTFSDVTLEKQELTDKIFENCHFKKSNFNETKFINCKFVDCEFKFCDLSAIKFKNTSFHEVVFDESKLIGINWTKAKWPYINLNSPIKFYKSDISYSSFYALELKEIIIEECKAHDVDFREGDFSHGNFILTDFSKSLFMHTKLCSSDFTEAINYYINPNDNDIRKTKFSMPDAMNLLLGFDIEIQGI